jgi:hypothetical protein
MEWIRNNSAIPPPRRDWPLALLLALATFIVALAYATHTPFGEPPDERAHAAYIDDVAVRGYWLPDYRDSRLGNRHGPRNYLMHPPLYYTTTGLVARVAGWSANGDFRALRVISALLVAAGMMLWCLALSAFGLPRRHVTVLVASTLAIPMFGYLAGALNNDNLAYFATALFFYGLSLLPRLPRGAWYAMAAGMAIALLTKATASGFLVFFALAWLVLRWRHGEPPLRHRHARIAVMLVVAVCATYYLPTLLEYGTPFPHPATMYAQRVPPVHADGAWTHAGRFLWTLLTTLPAVVSNRPFFPIPALLLPLFALMLLVAALAWALARRRAPRSPLRDIADAFILALLAAMLCHWAICYHDYLRHGVYAAIQPRYYNYVVPMLFALGFLLDRDRRGMRVLFAVFAACAVTVLVAAGVNTPAAHRAAERRAAIAADRIFASGFEATHR